MITPLFRNPTRTSGSRGERMAQTLCSGFAISCFGHGSIALCLGGDLGLIKALIVCLTILSPAFAKTQIENQDPPPQPEAQAGKPSNWQWSFSIRNRTGLRTDESPLFQMSRTIFDAKGVYKINDDWRMTLESRAHYDPVGRLGYPKGVWFDPRQAMLDGKIKKVDLKLGLQQVVWGQADGLRVLAISIRVIVL